jgi:Ca2+-binding RTX toxin-like protein
MKIRAGVAVLGLVLATVAVIASPARHAAAVSYWCNGYEATVVLDIGENYNGTSHADVVYGLGDNVINGNGGNDWICVVGEGSVVHGNSGNDYLSTDDDGVADLYGDSGNDELHARNAGTRAWGGSGNDYIHGWHPDYVDGGSGNDYIYEGHVITVHGGSGGDYIVLYYLADEVFGDSGSDRIYANHVDFVNCGSGRDHYAFDNVGSSVGCEVEDV